MSLLLKYEELYEWQKDFEIILLSDNSNKKIHWVIDKEGNNGEISFLKYMNHKYKICYVTDKKGDLINVVIKNKNYFEYGNERKFIFCDFLNYINPNHVNYGSLEMVNDGMICSNKYKCQSFLISPPIIIVFANFKPDYNKLSKYKFRIYTIENKQLYTENIVFLKKLFNVFKKIWIMKKLDY